MRLAGLSCMVAGLAIGTSDIAKADYLRLGQTGIYQHSKTHVAEYNYKPAVELVRVPIDGSKNPQDLGPAKRGQYGETVSAW